MRLKALLGLEKPVKIVPGPNAYWSERSGFTYYKMAYGLVQEVCPSPKTVIDVGSRGCPQLEWFPDAKRRVSVDLDRPYVADGIESVTGDFLKYRTLRRFNLCLCMQVLEHIPDAGTFAKKLLSISDHVVASVPYQWPEDACSEHVHDPVDEKKMQQWFGRAPDKFLIAEEKNHGRCAKRMICYYRV